MIGGMATTPIKFRKVFAGYYRWADGENEIMIERMDSHNCYFNRRIGTWALVVEKQNGFYRPWPHEAEYRTLADAKAAANITVQDWEWEKQQAEVAV